jgi:hypothetical protein
MQVFWFAVYPFHFLLKEEREKKFLVQSGQVLGTSSLVASSQFFSNEVLGARDLVASFLVTRY